MLRSRKYPKTMSNYPKLNDQLVQLLASPARNELLMAIDGAVGSRPDAADILSARKLVPMQLVQESGVLLDIVLGTRKARRLGKAREGWWFTSQGAEQGTHPSIAAHHAQRFTGCRHVVDICTGIGLDALAIAQVAQRVTTYESDAVTAALAEGNLRASGIANVAVKNQSVDTHTELPEFDGFWADPSRRRSDGSRTTSIKEYSPQLQTLDQLSKRNSDAIVGIKCGPGDTMPDAITAAYASEFVGFKGECRERVLWRNAGVPHILVSLPNARKHWSPIHDAATTFVPTSGQRTDSFQSRLPNLGDILVEPHAALIASGALGEFFREHQLVPIHEKIAYGIGQRETTDLTTIRDWMDAFEIVMVDTGVSEKRIQQHIRELAWNSRTEFKKRGWNGEPEELRAKLDFADSDKFGVVVIARTEQGHLTMFCKRLLSDEARESSLSDEAGRGSP